MFTQWSRVEQRHADSLKVDDWNAVASLARLKIRRGEHTGHTAGMAPGYVQGNLYILPKQYQKDFLRYCRQNPKSCPLLAMGKVTFDMV
jgi:uncharacterized protein YcsI (UPF0317 family)